MVTVNSSYYLDGHYYVYEDYGKSPDVYHSTRTINFNHILNAKQTEQFGSVKERYHNDDGKLCSLFHWHITWVILNTKHNDPVLLP